ncbi:hypothetical protein ACLOJK_023631 [Asimina triloba]
MNTLPEPSVQIFVSWRRSCRRRLRKVDGSRGDVGSRGDEIRGESGQKQGRSEKKVDGKGDRNEDVEIGKGYVKRGEIEKE